MQKYKAKTDPTLFILIVVIMLGSTLPLIYMAINETDPTGAVTGWGFALFMLLATAFCIHSFLATYYVIDDEELLVQAGLLYKKKKISVASIWKIKETRTLINAPAPSRDRIEVFYNRFDSIIVSPRDKQKFITHLIKLNPAIEVIN